MTVAPSLQAQLEKIRPVYDEIHQLRQRWEVLQTVDMARIEYQNIIASEDNKVKTLNKQKDILLEEKRRLTSAKEEFDEDFILPDGWQLQPRNTPRFQPTLASQPQPNREAAIAARNRLKKLANRCAKIWGLDTAILGQVNCIADDTDRPIGEALILLDWNVFADPTLTKASDETHLARLIEWGEALLDYRQHLAGEIDTLETRFRGWLGIWEAWRSRHLSPENQQRWQTLIAETKRAKLDEIARLTIEIDQLKQDIAELTAMPNRIGG